MPVEGVCGKTTFLAAITGLLRTFSPTMSRSTIRLSLAALLPLHLSGNPLTYGTHAWWMTLKLARNIDLCGLTTVARSMISASINSASAPVFSSTARAGILPIRQFYPTADSRFATFQRFADQFSVLGYHALQTFDALAYSPFAINTRPIMMDTRACFYLPPPLFLARSWHDRDRPGHMLQG